MGSRDDRQEAVGMVAMERHPTEATSRGSVMLLLAPRPRLPQPPIHLCDGKAELPPRPPLPMPLQAPAASVVVEGKVAARPAALAACQASQGQTVVRSGPTEHHQGAASLVRVPPLAVQEAMPRDHPQRPSPHLPARPLWVQ